MTDNPLDSLTVILALVAALGSGLIAGLFFAFSAFVMTALGRLPAAEGIAAMQAINLAVLNPVFFAAFFGTAGACLLLALLALARLQGAPLLLLLAGSLLYLGGGIGVTMLANVPMNRALATARPDSEAGAALWARYLRVWTAWTHVRTLASLAAAACFTLALV